MLIQKSKIQMLVSLVFIGFVGWWVSFQHVVDKQGTSVNWFENTYGLMALLGAVIGFMAIRKWGGMKTVLGKALLLFSLGLLAQEAGQLISSYYTQVDKVDLPYPSWGDAAYFGSLLLYIAAALYLSKFAGIKFALRKKKIYKIIAVVIPIVLVGAAYAILLHKHQYDTSKPLTVFLDAGYPVGDAIYVSIATVAYLLSRKLFGGVLRSGFVFIIVALLIQYVADFVFIYQNNRGTFVPGKYDDLVYLTAYFAMSTALVKFLTIYRRLGVQSDGS